MPDNQKTIVVEIKSWRRQTYYRRDITGMIASEGLQALQGPPSSWSCILQPWSARYRTRASALRNESAFASLFSTWGLPVLL
jgi:hypothetical protein